MEAIASSLGVSRVPISRPASQAASHTATPRSPAMTLVASSHGSALREVVHQARNFPRASPPQCVCHSASLAQAGRHVHPHSASPSSSSSSSSPSSRFSLPSSSPRHLIVCSLKEGLPSSSASALPTPSIPSLPPVPPGPAHVIPAEDLPAFVACSPLLQRVGLSQADVQRDVRAWGALGHELAQQLGFLGKGGKAQLGEAQLRRIFQYYLPVFSWCWRQLQLHRAQAAGGGAADAQAAPLVIGISAPQGCGKTTVVESLEHLFTVTRCTAATVSIDDFYLTAQGQAALREAHPGNRLLELRGNAGSHDLPLGVATLSALKHATAPGTKVALPRYDKSAFSGRGDRSPPSQWPAVQGPVDVVLFEGWMLGFQPVHHDAAAAVDPQLEEVNVRLAEYSAWHDLVDAWVIIQVADVDWVFEWRLQAEVAMRATASPA
ncbi:hypothetical protein CLOM_g18293 [Closterium sp. NIES-68]|nr:hypothetical protein CLOM_g18293 [Closterium sp. NIES-68]